MKTGENTRGIRKTHHLRVFLITAAVVGVLGTFAYVYSITPLIYSGLEKAIVQDGLGSGSAIPVNTFYTVPQLASPSAKSRLLRTGANVDTLYSGGLLDLKEKPLVLHVPDMNGRYYSVQFTDPKDGQRLRLCRATYNRHCSWRLPHYRSRLERGGPAGDEEDLFTGQQCTYPWASARGKQGRPCDRL